MKENAMCRDTYENQSMLVAGIVRIIVATASPVIHQELKQVSPNMEGHFRDNAPGEQGLYVWEGTLTVETGGGRQRGAWPGA